MAQNPLEDVTKIMKDALYVSVGLGVIAVQKAQVRRQEIGTQLSKLSLPEVGKRASGGDPREQLAKVASLVDERLRVVEERLGAVEQRVDTAIDQVEAILPEQLQDLSKQVRAAAKTARETARQQMHDVVGRVNGATS
jgi:hypothetical protein